ncbi:MAG: hypothetical protein ACLP66_21980 [Polyangia bacterium]
MTAPPQHWKYVSYADIRKIIEDTPGVPKEAVEALTVAFFLSARRPPQLNELWACCDRAMIALAKWLAKEGGPKIFNHIDGIHRAFSEPFMAATLIQRRAEVDREPGVASEASPSSTGVDCSSATDKSISELALEAYRGAERWMSRNPWWPERVVSVPDGVGGKRVLKKLVLLKDATSMWDFLQARDGSDRPPTPDIGRAGRSGRAGRRSGYIGRREAVELFMYLGERILEESGFQPDKASKKVLQAGKRKRARPTAKRKRRSWKERDSALAVIDCLMASLCPPPQRGPEKDELIPGKGKMRHTYNMARQADRHQMDQTALETIRELLEAIAVEFKQRSWWIPDHRK